MDGNQNRAIQHPLKRMGVLATGAGLTCSKNRRGGKPRPVECHHHCSSEMEHEPLLSVSMDVVVLRTGR